MTKPLEIKCSEITQSEFQNTSNNKVLRAGMYRQYYSHILEATKALGPYKVLKYDLPEGISVRGMAHYLRMKFKPQGIFISANTETKTMFVWREEITNGEG